MTERVSARMPDAVEAELLDLPGEVRVLSALVVACGTSGLAVRVPDVLLPVDRQGREDAYRLD
ncbi:hypothetical protein GCM10010515_59580 [Streptomyces fructofermentans]|uniref:Uncharacterized protein n=1 Tax=Streptomyces fructofermentans TaxID=152141 RepID=A0A918U2Z1_9ACTN|nr:hypothetical protein GCM10010515_59580 [Streptomyces fructofermentans]